MKNKLLEIYQYSQFSIGVFMLLFGVAYSSIYLVLIGIYVAVLAVGTVYHLVTGKHNKFSKFPEDYRNR